MAKRAVVVGGATGTGSTTSITSSGFGTPDGAILFINQVTADATDTDHNSLSISFWDGSNIVCRPASDMDAQNTTITGSGVYNASIRLVISGTTLDAEGTISAITDGISISWSNAPGSSWRYTAILLGGGVSVKAGTLQMSGTNGGTAVYSGASFTPQVGLFVSSSYDLLNDFANPALFSLGIFTYSNSTITQRALDYYSDDAVGTSYVGGYAANARVHAYPATGAEQASVTAVSSSGFTVTTNTGAFAAQLGFFLLGNINGVWLGDTPVPTSTGVKSWEPGFWPDLVLMAQSGLEAYNTLYTNEDVAYTLGVSDGATSRSVAGWSDDAAGVSDTKGRHSATLLQSVQTTYADTYTASLSGFNALGWDANYSAIAANAKSDIGFSLAISLEPRVVGSALFMGAGI
jgi:hypothetical protein